MTALALALVAGVAARTVGAPLLAAPLLAATLLLPIRPWTRPARRNVTIAGLLLLASGGWLHADARVRAGLRDCRRRLPPDSAVVVGVVVDRDGPGRPRVRAEAGLEGGCREVVRVLGPSGADLAVGTRVRMGGRWQATATDAPDALRSGLFRAATLEEAGGGASGADAGSPASRAGALVRASARLRGAAAASLSRRLPRERALALALVVARKDALDPAVREAFVRSGTAHLLAISGFHVGVLTLLTMTLARRLGATRRRSAAIGALVAWGYSGVLGLPDAATRAALLATLLALGRLLDRPVLATGALSTALAAFLVLDPGALGRIGFQLSFAGTFGLALAARPLEARLRRRVGLGAREGPGGPASPGRVPPRVGAALSPLVSGLAASAGATLLTLPLVAWHFEAVPLTGVVTTLVAGPLVAAALPGLLASVLLDLAHLPGAGLPAAGAEALLTATRVVVGWVASPGWVVLPVARPQVLAAGTGAVLGALVLARTRRVGGAVRWGALALGCASAVLIHPVAEARLRDGGMELHVLDVGQGDALALRTPRGRWVLVDAGPGEGPDLVRSLRRLGVDEVAALVLTHPDLDHVGGAPAVLEAFRVGRVLDPGTVRGSGPYRRVLEAAREADAAWLVVDRGDRLDLDGVRLEVLHPSPPGASERSPGEADPNDRSVVILLEWRGFTALLTGDAPVEAERTFGPAAGPVDVLKVGHHGSITSTGAALLREVRPRVAIIPVGRYNRFGHPSPTVTARLGRAGIPTYRTDLHGAVTVRVSPSGEWRVEVARSGSD